MSIWLQGFLQFRAWLPEPLLDLIDPSGKATSLHVRTLLALAIAAFLWSFVARTLWGIGLALRDWLAGRRLVVQVGTAMSWVAWLVGAGAALLPWLALWLTSHQGQVHWGLVSGAATLALIWAGLRVAERDRMFLLPADDCLIVTRSLPGLRVAEYRIPLDMLLPFSSAEAAATGRQSELAAFLRQQLGSERAVTRYLHTVARRRRKQT